MDLCLLHHIKNKIFYFLFFFCKNISEEQQLKCRDQQLKEKFIIFSVLLTVWKESSEMESGSGRDCWQLEPPSFTGVKLDQNWIDDYPFSVIWQKLPYYT